MATVGLSLFEAGLYVGLFFLAALCLGKALCWSSFVLAFLYSRHNFVLVFLYSRQNFVLVFTFGGTQTHIHTHTQNSHQHFVWAGLCVVHSL